MLDREVIESKLWFLREYLNNLKDYESISLSDYKTNKKDQRFAERTLHLACECCIDIAAHIISRMGLREPVPTQPEIWPVQALLPGRGKDRSG